MVFFGWGRGRGRSLYSRGFHLVCVGRRWEFVSLGAIGKKCPGYPASSECVGVPQQCSVRIAARSQSQHERTAGC